MSIINAYNKSKSLNKIKFFNKIRIFSRSKTSNKVTGNIEVMIRSIIKVTYNLSNNLVINVLALSFSGIISSD